MRPERIIVGISFTLFIASGISVIAGRKKLAIIFTYAALLTVFVPVSIACVGILIENFVNRLRKLLKHP